MRSRLPAAECAEWRRFQYRHMFISLKPLNERGSALRMSSTVSVQVEPGDGASAFLQRSRIFASGGGQQCLYQYTIQADTLTDLNTGAPAACRDDASTGFQDVSSDQQNGGWMSAALRSRDCGEARQTAQSLDGTIQPSVSRKFRSSTRS